jgi:hypothetical protein
MGNSLGAGDLAGTLRALWLDYERELELKTGMVIGGQEQLQGKLAL